MLPKIYVGISLALCENNIIRDETISFKIINEKQGYAARGIPNSYKSVLYFINQFFFINQL